MDNRGKMVFDSLVEYPLPKQTGVRDYLFYFVSSNDGYGKGARYFFDKFYPNHSTHSVGSIEDLIATLHKEVTERGVQSIREVVLIAHGTPIGLLLPILNGVTDSNLREFKYTTAFSLACLQKDFLDGKFAALRQRRTKVLEHLKDDSWVTIRACNFGKSNEGMYALYSFFGGKANIYAPTEYQFFGTHPIMDGMRLESKLEVHEHLVKQHYLPKDIHSPERKDAITRALVDPAQFSESFELASMRVDNPEPQEAAAYEKLIDDLNARRVSDHLRSRFLAQGFELTRHPAVRVINKDSAWMIKDQLTHEGKSFPIEYSINEELGFTEPANRRVVKLSAAAHLVRVRSASEFFPLQLFFYGTENEIWRGKLFTLAAYTEEPDAAPQHKQKFDALMALLNQGQFRDDAGNDLREEFKKSHDIELSAQARIRKVSTTGSAPLERITWVIEDRAPSLVKLEHPDTSNGIPAHTLTVYDNPDQKSRLVREYELMAYLGSSPDTPGTELAAYLDRCTLDELIALIDYLRSPYKPGHSIYIHHAQQALVRKKDFPKWWAEHGPDPDQFVLPTDSDYTELSLSEREDKRDLAYDFDFNSFWSEVKASAPSSVQIREDLFTEEDLAQKLKIPPEEISVRKQPPDAEPDSPFADVEELRHLERLGIERFFSTEKFVVDQPEDDEKIACEEFAEVIAKWKEFQGLDPAEIEKRLGLLKTSDGKTYLQRALQLWDMTFPLRMGGSLMNMAFLRDGIFVKIVAKIPGVVAVAGEGAIVTSTTLALLRVMPAIAIPWRMWKEFLMEQQKTEAAWETIGRVTAIRQWLRQLELLTFSKENDFPDQVTIDLNFISAEPYFIGRYYQEQLDEHGRFFRFIFAPKRMKKGFDEGAQMMEKVGNEIMDKAEELIGKVLQELQLNSCKIKVLIEAGLLDFKNLKAHVVRHLTRALLDELPKV